jgi:NAD-dependent deacetylase
MITRLSGATLRALPAAAAILRQARRLVVLTGAGISTASGIPDFRSTKSGLWERHNPFEVASLSAFRYHPERFFAWVRPLTREILQAQPNPAHLALARLEAAGRLKTLITQNIDSLHQRAGSQRVLEVHGALDRLVCVQCYQAESLLNHWREFLESEELPRCAACGGLLKPDAVLFGEQLPARVWMQALEAGRACDAMVVIGSSLEVLPVAGLPLRALDNGAHLILINQSPTYVDLRADFVFAEDVVDLLPRLVSEVIGD